jgi:hypothetical protein
VMIVAMNPGQKTSAPSNPSASTSKAAASAGSTEPPRRHLAWGFTLIHQEKNALWGILGVTLRINQRAFHVLQKPSIYNPPWTGIKSLLNQIWSIIQYQTTMCEYIP